MKYFFKILLNLFYSLLIFGALAVFLLFIRLQIAPLDVSFLFDTRVIPFSPPQGTVYLKWERFYENPELYSSDLSFSNDQIEVTTAASVKVDLGKALLGTFEPKHFVLKDLRAKYSLDAGDKHERLTLPSSVLKKFQSLRIENGEVLFEADQKVHHFSHVTLDFLSQNKQQSISGRFHLNGQAFFIDALHNPEAQENEDYLSATLRFEKNQLKELPYLKDVSFLSHSLLGAPESGLFTLKCQKKADNAYDFSLFLEEKIVTPKDPSTLSFQVTGSYKQEAFNYAAQLTVKKLYLDTLSRFWPAFVAPSAREWLLENISEGLIPSVSVFAEGSGTLTNLSKHTLKKISGFLSLENASVQYMEGLPRMKNTHAVAYFTDQGFKIAFLKGCAEGVCIEKGEMLIENMLSDDPKARLMLKLKSPFKPVLKLIDTKPLALLDKFDMDIDNAKGNAFIQLSMNFPLLKELSLEDIDLDIKASLDQVCFEKKAYDQVLSLKNGRYDLEVSSQELHMHGMTELNDISTQFVWHSYFYPKKTYKNHYRFQCDAKFDQFPGLNLGFLSQIFPGPLTLDVMVKELVGDQIHVEVKSKLKKTPVSLPLLGLLKPEGEEGSLYAHLIFQEGALKHISQLTYKDETGEIELEGNFEGPDRFKIQVRDFSVLANKFSGSFSKSPKEGLMIHLKGPLLDLSHIDLSSLSQGEGDSLKKLMVALSFDQVKLKRDIVLQKFSGTYGDQGPDHAYAYASGQFYGENGFDLTYLDDQGVQKLIFKTDNLGLITRGFDLNSEIYGGKVLVTAASEDVNGPLVGHGRMKDLVVKNIPSIVQILNFASISGLTQLIQGSGFPFSEGRFSFHYQAGLLTVTESLLNGAGVALSAAGGIDWRKKTLNLAGEVVPFRSVNQFLGSIPVLGTILSGGSPERGIFSFSYGVSGPFDEPIVSSNPLSIFAPRTLKSVLQG